MTKRHKRDFNVHIDNTAMNREIKRRKSISSKPRTKERTSPGELHKVQ